MKTVVITGSTRGIGRGLAESFLQHGCQVVINGRKQESVNQAIAGLTKTHPAENVHGYACDVTSTEQLQAMWASAVERFGKVDIWINNAGRTHSRKNSWELTSDNINSMISINLIGVINGSHTAMHGMLAQGHGQIFNMEGFGSSGQIRVNMSIYSATKAAVRSFTRTLSKEAADTVVKVGTLSPGIVITDLLIDQYDDDAEAFEKAKRIFNILGDQVETVTPWLVERVLSSNKNGDHFTWLTTPKVIGRFLVSPFRKRDLFASK